MIDSGIWFVMVSFRGAEGGTGWFRWKEADTGEWAIARGPTRDDAVRRLLGWLTEEQRQKINGVKTYRLSEEQPWEDKHE